MDLVRVSQLYSVIFRKTVSQLELNEENKQLLAACSDGTIKIFNLENIGSITEAQSSHKISSKPITCFKDNVEYES